MITMAEILGANLWDALLLDHKSNLIRLHYCLNVIRRSWNQPIVITSGYRSELQHRRIYKEKGIDNPPMGSCHLIGAAADISDPQGILKTWISQHLEICEELG